MVETSSSHISGNHAFSLLSQKLQQMRLQYLSSSSYFRRDDASSLLWQQQRVLAPRNTADDVPTKEVDEADPGGKPGRWAVEAQLSPPLLNSSGLVEVLAFGSFETMPVSMLVHAKESVPPAKAVHRSSMYRIETKSEVTKHEYDKPRYLCISNGLKIFCLDLKLRHDQCFRHAEGVPPFPFNITLTLAEKDLPSSVGLFKMGSDAYMIGGQLFPPVPDSVNEYCIDKWGENPRGWLDYKTFCYAHKAKGTSCDTYGLSLVDGALSHSKSSFYKLKEPKLWPIVEKIDGKIHVIDSAPSPQLVRLCTGWMFTHETLSLDSGKGDTIPTIKDKGYISSHSVVGNRIYAVTDDHCLVFDSEINKWEAPQPRINWEGPFSVKLVWDILDLGVGRCVGGFRYGEPSNPLYVLVAVVQEDRDKDYGEEGYRYGVHAMAYLVTSTGQVVCFQRLPHFFEGPVEPYLMDTGTMINVDEERNIMCSIVNGAGADDEGDENWVYVFITTFTVEILPNADSKVRLVWAKGSEAWPVEQDFVRVHVDVNDRYIYKTDGDDVFGWIGGMRACFL